MNRTSILALAATVVFGAGLLASTAVEARPHGGGGGGIHRGGGGGMRLHGGGGGFHRHGHVHRMRIGGPLWRHPHRHHRHWHHRHWHRYHVRYRPIYYTAPVVYGVSRPAVAGPCMCLTKEYTPEGAVLFKDRCTNEMAMNPPPLPPQQTGQIEPQSAPVQYVPQYPPQTTPR